MARARSEGKRTLAGDQEELVGDVGLDWEPVKVEDGGGGRPPDGILGSSGPEVDPGLSLEKIW